MLLCELFSPVLIENSSTVQHIVDLIRDQVPEVIEVRLFRRGDDMGFVGIVDDFIDAPRLEEVNRTVRKIGQAMGGMKVSVRIQPRSAFDAQTPDGGTRVFINKVSEGHGSSAGDRVPAGYFDLTPEHLVGGGYPGSINSQIRREALVARGPLGRLQPGDVGRRIYHGEDYRNARCETVPEYYARTGAAD